MNKSTIPSIIVAAVLAAGAGAGVAYLLVKPQPAAGGPGAKVDEQAVERMVAERVRAELEKVKQPAAPVKPEVKRPPAVKTYTFAEAWSEAEKLHEKLNAAEVEATKKAISRLGGLDESIGMGLADRRGDSGFSPDDLRNASRLGLDDLYRRMCRSSVIPSTFGNDFKTAVKTLWKDNYSPQQIILAAEYWGSCDFRTRDSAKNAIEKGVKPSTTEAIRLVESLPGGDAWLEKLK